MKKSWRLYLCLLPFLAVFFAFTILPVIRSLYYSFCYFNILQDPQWIWLDNYKNLLLNDDVFITAVINTVVFAVATGPGGYFIALLLAWMINDFSRAVRTVLVIVFYAPSISGQLFVIWQLIFSGDSQGYANSFLTSLGFIKEPIQWLTDPAYMMGVCIVVALWMSLGAGFLSFIAGFQGVDRGLYEAAAIDGVTNRYQELWYVTLPSIKPQLMFGAVMSITTSFGVGDVITQLVGYPSNGYAVHTAVHHMQDYGGMRFEMGYASTVAVFLFALMLISWLLVNKLLAGVSDD